MAPCGACGSRETNKKYEHTDRDGKITVYRSQVEANAAKARRGGTVKPV